MIAFDHRLLDALVLAEFIHNLLQGMFTDLCAVIRNQIDHHVFMADIDQGCRNDFRHMRTRCDGTLFFNTVGIVTDNVDQILVIENFGKFQDRQGHIINVACKGRCNIVGHKRGLLKVLGQRLAHTHFRVTHHQPENILGKQTFAVTQAFSRKFTADFLGRFRTILPGRILDQIVKIFFGYTRQWSSPGTLSNRLPTICNSLYTVGPID